MCYLLPVAIVWAQNTYHALDPGVVKPPLVRTRASTIAKPGLGRAPALVTNGLAVQGDRSQGHRSAKSFGAKRSIFISITRFGARDIVMYGRPPGSSRHGSGRYLVALHAALRPHDLLDGAGLLPRRDFRGRADHLGDPAHGRMTCPL